jgi:hypothetical protein
LAEVDARHIHAVVGQERAADLYPALDVIAVDGLDFQLDEPVVEVDDVAGFQ